MLGARHVMINLTEPRPQVVSLTHHKGILGRQYNLHGGAVRSQVNTGKLTKHRLEETYLAGKLKLMTLVSL